MRTVLLTGGLGYIGSHVAVALHRRGVRVILFDNLCNSSLVALRRLGRVLKEVPLFVQGDIRDRLLLRKVFSDFEFDAVMHFAGLKAVAESVRRPLEYYENNVSGSIALFEAMAEAGVCKLVFSSSASVYGESMSEAVSEDSPVGSSANPYARSKQMVENVLFDLGASDPRWRIGILRYFNPIGADESGLIGESPNGLPTNLVPYIARVAQGLLPELLVFGSDYQTVDGTGVRDYIHVVDLAEGHIHAYDALGSQRGAHVWNLGTGQGYSVLEVVRAFEAASGCAVRYRFAPRRAGDVASCFANPSKAARELGWYAKRGLGEMMQDTWRWEQSSRIDFR